MQGELYRNTPNISLVDPGESSQGKQRGIWNGVQRGVRKKSERSRGWFVVGLYRSIGKEGSGLIHGSTGRTAWRERLEKWYIECGECATTSVVLVVNGERKLRERDRARDGGRLEVRRGKRCNRRGAFSRRREET